MGYTIERENAPREPFGNYTYLIRRDGVLVARYWHDYRGDDHGVEFVDGRSEDWPVGRMIDFVEGGGPMPLVLSERAVAWLRERLE